MSNDFKYTPAQVGEVAMTLAKGAFQLASLVTRYGPDEFTSGRGDTVFLNVPGVLTASSRALDDVTTSIVLDSLSEREEPIKLATHAISAVGLSEKDLSLDLVDFGRQVLAPQTDAVVDKIESAIERVLAGLPVTDADYSASDPIALFSAARRELRNRGIDVAAEKLVAIVGGNVVDALFDSGALDFDKTGSADALRDGSLGRIRGFEAVESGKVAADEVVFMTTGALYLASRAPKVPEGAPFGQIVNAGGFSLRYLRDYDPMHTQDRSVVSTFVGAGVMPLYKVNRTPESGKQGDTGYARSTVSLDSVTGGAVVKFDTAA